MPSNLNWSKIGTALRESALEAHEGGLPPLKIAYEFLLEQDDWCVDGEWLDTADLPEEPPAELMAAYYCVEVIR